MQRELPSFSIIIPTYGRPERLAACLEALARLDYPRGRFEVIVVDDGGSAPLGDVVSPFAGRLDIELLVRPHAGPAAARNSGAARGGGEFVVFTDDDCAPAPDWLKALAARFAAGANRMVGGRTRNALDGNPYAAASQLILDMVYAYYNNDPDSARLLTSNNMAVPADRFRAIGGFDASFTLAAAEDREFCDRWLNQDYLMTYAPEAVIYHYQPATFRSFWRRHFNYGRGAFRFHQARARRGGGRFRFELGFYRLLLGYFIGEIGKRRASVVALLVAWKTAESAGFVREALAATARRLMAETKRGVL